MEPPGNIETESRKQLVALLTQHQRRIFAYIYTLVHDRTDAEDILQETNLIICEKFHEFVGMSNCLLAGSLCPPEIRARQSHLSSGTGGRARPNRR